MSPSERAHNSVNVCSTPESGAIWFFASLLLPIQYRANPSTMAQSAAAEMRESNVFTA